MAEHCPRAGEVIMSKEGSFRWDIQNFLRQISKLEELSSPPFTFSGSRYFIKLGKPDKLDRIRVHFGRTSDSPPQNILVTISAVAESTPGKENERSCTMTTDESMVDLGVTTPASGYIPVRPNRLTTDGWLTVFCELRREAAGYMHPSEGVRNRKKHSETDSDEDEDFDYETFKKLQRDMRNLLESGEGCDVTLKVETREFPAHRIILRVRSLFFNAMLSKDLEENNTSVLEIYDCDPSTFADLLEYLYSGSTKHISEKNVCQLYTVSDKYHVGELKRKCADFMVGHLSVETFCDFFDLALKHEEEGLVSSARRFFCANPKEIVESDKWPIFLKDNSTIGNELCQKYFP